MRKQEREALRRLEAALLEQEQPQDLSQEEMEEPEAFWQALPDDDYDIYNTDVTDVDLDDYSEDVHRGSQSSPFLSVFIILCVFLLFAAVWILLDFLGVF